MSERDVFFIYFLILKSLDTLGLICIWAILESPDDDDDDVVAFNIWVKWRRSMYSECNTKNLTASLCHAIEKS